MDGPVDWWWKMSLLDVCVQAGFCQIRSHMMNYLMRIYVSFELLKPAEDDHFQNHHMMLLFILLKAIDHSHLIQINVRCQ